MTTMDSVRALAYPVTCMPVVAGTAEHRNVLLVETDGGAEGIALHPFLLCQDWDKRVVIHWEDDHGSHTYTVLQIVVDNTDRFEFVREDEPAGRVALTVLTFERFEREYRSQDPDAGSVPQFESEEQFRRWFLPG